MAVYAAVRLATEVIGAPIERVVMYGRSIGTGPIAAASARLDMMARSRPAAMILRARSRRLTILRANARDGCWRGSS